jgi:ceramide glucosyltransferase
MDNLALIAAVPASAGLIEAVAGWTQVARFAARGAPPPPDQPPPDQPSGQPPPDQPPPDQPSGQPPVTVLKPLHGDEPLLEAALASICEQDYADWQVVFGVQDAADPAVAVVRRLQARYPDCDITLVVDPATHGANRKVGNLINMLPAARHDVLVIADSDLHVEPDYLQRLVTALAEPGTGLVTTLYAGLPADQSVAARLGATQITHGFLPGALLARTFGRQDSLGATMCLRRETLVRIGGLQALVDHLADDNVLGKLVQALGLQVRLADTVPLTTVPETRMHTLFRHELRWARTIRTLVPLQFAVSALRYPLFWATLTMVAAGGSAWSVALFAITWVMRALAAAGIDRTLSPKLGGRVYPVPVSLLPLRDLLSITVMVASYAGKRVDWRGYSLHAGTPRTKSATTPPVERPILSLRPAEDPYPR